MNLYNNNNYSEFPRFLTANISDTNYADKTANDKSDTRNMHLRSHSIDFLIRGYPGVSGGVRGARAIRSLRFDGNTILQWTDYHELAIQVNYL